MNLKYLFGSLIGVPLLPFCLLYTSPDTPLAHHIKNELRNRHILISADGPHDSVLKSKPPLCFTKENAKEVVDAIDQVLEIYPY